MTEPLPDPLRPPPLPPPVPAAASPSTVALPDPAYTVLSFPLACIQCDYNLEGLSLDGVCPECGTPIARSASGDLLIFTPMEDIRRIDRGVRDAVRGLTLFITTLALVTVVGMLVIGLVPVSSRPQLERPARIALGLVGLTLFTLAIARHLRGWLALARPVHGASELTPYDPKYPLLRLVATASSLGLWVLAAGLLFRYAWIAPGARVPPALQVLLPIGGAIVATALGVFWTLACLVGHTLLLKVPLRQRAAKLKTVTWTMLPTLAVVGLAAAGSVRVPLVPCAFVVVGGVWLLFSFSRALDALLDLA
ncbi:MAG: hypothetical protein K2Q20_07240, partial [Phycisphaerales bacterium]|nr:hypothetical protein [Phycisphaerales bacterium]